MAHSKNTAYQHLLEPFQLKHLELKNRIVKAAQWTVFAEPDGSVGPRILDFYESLARGGVGLITVEESICDFPLGASNMPHLRLDDHRFLPGLTELAAVIHKHHCPALVQITHAGPAHNPMVSKSEPVAPSRLEPPAEPVFAPARELTADEIRAIIEKFARAAERVQKAGFDGVEIHLAHYALGNAFLSRVQNRRDDEYGAATLENRARFALEILERTRQLCGQAFIVGVRMNGREWGHELGTTQAEAIEFARMFQATGADYLQVSAYGYGPFALNALPELVLYPEPADVVKPFAREIEDGALLPDAEAVRDAVDIPVSGVGHLELEAAEKALKKDRVDLIALGRPLLVDPELPRKLEAGIAEQVRPCLRCNVCLSHILTAQPVVCRLNPFLGREGEWTVHHVARPGRVVIIGAGPAGLEAARIAAERGHQVLLYDKSSELGGLMPMAAFIKGTTLFDDLLRAIEWYRRELARLGVEVHLGVEVSPELLQVMEPDAVLLATGGKPLPLQVAGADLPHVMTTEDLKGQAHPYLHLFGSRMMNRLSKVYLPDVGSNVVIVGGDLAGLETAEFLGKRGRRVTVLEEGSQPGAGMPLAWLARLLPWMEAREFPLLLNTIVEEVVPQGVVVRRKTDDGDPGERQVLQADTVLFITRYEANDELMDGAQVTGARVKRIGDASGEMGLIQGAVASGARAALELPGLFIRRHVSRT